MTRRWWEPQGPAEPGAERPLGHKLAWFAALAAGGLVAVAVTAYALRGVLLLAG